MNIWAWIIIGLQVFNVLVTPFLIGEERRNKYWTAWDWLSSAVGLIMLLLAFKLI